MRTLIIGDPHIQDSAIEELSLTFKEVMTYDADELVCVGDWFDKKYPIPKELYFGTQMAKALLDRYKTVYIIEGNHDKLSADFNNISYLKFMGINIKEDEWKHGPNLYGHFFLKESADGFDKFRYGIDDICNDYDNIFLGHQHSPQMIEPNAYHIGSLRYVGFGEEANEMKQIVLLNASKIEAINLKSPINMIDVYSVEELENIPQRTKVRIVFKTFEQFKNEVSLIQKYKEHFHVFKTKLAFEDKQVAVEQEPKQSLEEIVNKWLDGIEDIDVKDILEKEMSNGN